MRYCHYCQVHIRGNQQHCPLCKNTLTGESNQHEEIFPYVPPSYQRHFIIRIMVFISIVAIVTSFAVHQIFPSKINWPILVLFSLLSMWISLGMIIIKMHNIPKNIMWQVIIVSFLCIFWDWRTNWRGWSLDYALPTIYVSAMFVMYVTAKVMRLSARDYIFYFLLDGIFGILPVVFILLNWVHVTYPSIICVGISIIFLSAIFIFQGENIKEDLNKRMHV